MTQHRWSIALSLIVVAGAVLLFLPGAGQTDKDSQTSKQIAKLNERIDDLQKQVHNLSRTSPAVGTVVAFAGEWPPAKGEGGKWTEAELGWMLCDGRNLVDPEYAELRVVLGKGSLPDYRGLFLRGLDVGGRTDPDGKQRTIGSYQGDGIAKHQHHVRLSGGGHDHAIPFHRPDGKDPGLGNGAICRYVNMNEERRNTLTKGDHTHDGHTDVDGGGNETRPKNRAVHWIIKFK